MLLFQFAMLGVHLFELLFHTARHECEQNSGKMAQWNISSFVITGIFELIAPVIFKTYILIVYCYQNEVLKMRQSNEIFKKKPEGGVPLFQVNLTRMIALGRELRDSCCTLWVLIKKNNSI